MIKKITTLASTHKKTIAKKVLIVGGIALGLVAGALLVKNDTLADDSVVIYTNEDGSFTVRETKQD